LRGTPQAQPFVASRISRGLLAGEDDVSGLLGDEIDGARDEESRNAREHRGVDDAEAGRVVYPEIAAEDAAAIGRPNRARPTRVMAPGVLAHVLRELVVALAAVAGDLFGRADAAGAQLLVEAADQLHAFDERPHVLIAALAE